MNVGFAQTFEASLLLMFCQTLMYFMNIQPFYQECESQLGHLAVYHGVYCYYQAKILVWIRAVLILPAIFLEKQEAKSKEQNAGKIGKILEKQLSESCNLAHLTLQRWRHFNRIVINHHYAHVKTAERSRYSDKAVTML